VKFLLFTTLFALHVELLGANEGSLRLPKELENAQLEDKAGVQIPLDIEIIDQDGHRRDLKYYFNNNNKLPIILTLGYYGCPMLCGLVLNGLVNALKQVDYKISQDYRIISLSIDPREDINLAKAKQNNYLDALGIKNSDAWIFHVADEENIKKLAQSVGFNFYFDSKANQFAHGAGFFVLSPQGVLARTLFGISYEVTDIKLALTEAAQGKIGSFLDQILLSCFHYNPDSQRYGVYIMGVMRLGGLLTVLILGGVLLMYFRRERKRSVV
jgi:protein SCO1/2